MKLTQTPLIAQKASFKQLPKGVVQMAAPIVLGTTLLPIAGLSSVPQRANAQEFRSGETVLVSQLPRGIKVGDKIDTTPNYNGTLQLQSVKRVPIEKCKPVAIKGSEARYNTAVAKSGNDQRKLQDAANFKRHDQKIINQATLCYTIDARRLNSQPVNLQFIDNWAGEKGQLPEVNSLGRMPRSVTYKLKSPDPNVIRSMTLFAPTIGGG